MIFNLIENISTDNIFNEKDNKSLLTLNDSKKYEELLKNNNGDFHEASSVLKAYLTDMIQELIDSQIPVEPVFISGKWCEIDTMQDLKRAEEMF